MIELSLLRQFLSFAECGTLSAASEQLHISQPALTHSMQKLEELMEVPLFDRKKNRITLNENGRLLAEHAAKLLDQEQDMIERIRRFDRSRRTITLGSCAPVPVADLVPLLTRLFDGMTIASEICGSDGELCAGLRKNRYQLVVLSEKPEADDMYFFAYRQEKLFLALPLEHPLASLSKIRLSDIDGQNLLLYTKIGFWHNMCREKLPNAHFLFMNEQSAFNEVAETSAFPSFISDAFAIPETYAGRKKVVPILDPEASVTYYCTCLLTERKRLEPLFHALRSTGQYHTSRRDLP